MIKQHQRFFNFMKVLLDALFLFSAYFCSVLLKMRYSEITLAEVKYISGPLWMVPLLLATYYFMDVYSPIRGRLYRKEALLITRAHLVGIVIIFSLLFLQKNLEFSREVSLLFAFFGLMFVLLEKLAIRRTLLYLRSKGYNQKHMLIIGAGALGAEFARKVNEHRNYGYNITGFLDDDDLRHANEVAGKPVLGSCAMLPEILKTHALDEVIVALPLHMHENYASIVDHCEKAGVRIRIIPDYNVFFQGVPRIEEFDGIPLLNARLIPLDDPFNAAIKRLFDVFISLVGIILTGPLMIAIACAVKFTSRGPVFFRQERVGANNRIFSMLKFRTMHIAADNSPETFWTTPDDKRKTTFGAFLRRTSFDELPQFFNVLTGSMSLVGPRPERPFFVEQFRKEIPQYMVKHQVKPGITGWAQVNGWRGDTSIHKRIECDIYYIENWDLLLDCKIVFWTLFKGLVNKNAY